MQSIIEFKNIDYATKEKTIFKNFNLSINSKKKLGILERDTDRETIFYNLIKKNIQPESGTLHIEPSYKIEFLDLSIDWEEKDLAIDYLIKTSKQDPFICMRYASFFGFNHSILEMPIKDFPNSARYTLKMISILAKEPDFMILFQPTVFLNLISQLILEKILKTYWHSKGVLLISNDLEILQSYCDEIYFLEEHKFQLYKESYKNQYKKNYPALIKTLSDILSFRSWIKRIFWINKTILKTNFIMKDPLISPFTVEAKLKFQMYKKYALIGIFRENIKLFLHTISGNIIPLEGNYEWLTKEIGYLNKETIQNLNQNLKWKDLGNLYFIDLTKLSNLLIFFELQNINLNDQIKNSNLKTQYKMYFIFLILQKKDVLVIEYPEKVLSFDELNQLGYILKHFDRTVICTSNNRSFIDSFASNIVEVQTKKIYDPQMNPKQYFSIKKILVENEFQKDISKIFGNFSSQKHDFSYKKNGHSPFQIKNPNDLFEKKKALLLFFDKEYRERKREISILKEELRKMEKILKEIEKKRDELWEYINQNQLYTSENYEKMKQLNKRLQELELKWYELQKKLEELE